MWTVSKMAPADVPEFPAFRQISIEDGEGMEQLLATYPSSTSERTFGSMYIWRTYGRRSEFSVLGDHLLISWFKRRFGRLILPPVGPDPVGMIEKLVSRDAFRAEGFRGVYGLVDPEVSQLIAKGFSPQAQRDEFDYVYRVADLIGLQGPKYHTQRKELAKATSQHTVRYEEMTEEHRFACLELQERWCDLKHCSLDPLSAAEDLALKDALENLNRIGFFGGVAVIDGKIQALTVGERLDPKTAVVHFEKANPEIRGLYQFINQRFCANALKGFEFVNREQDVGEPGLRRAKEGYRPHHFVEKHVLLTSE
jgi:hypothetical protein